MDILPDEILHLILSHTNKHSYQILERVCKKWLWILINFDLWNIKYNLDMILSGNAKQLSFESCYRSIYSACLEKKQNKIIRLIKNECKKKRFKIKWYDRIHYSRLIGDISIYLDKTSNKKKSVGKIVLNVLAGRT